MFERFTDRARHVLVVAIGEADGLGHHLIGTQHILLGLIEEGDGVAGVVLAELGFEADAVRAEASRIDPAGPARMDAEALETIGIDLDAVRAKVDASFGPGALDRPSKREKLKTWRFAPGAKNVLDASLREALQLGHNYIGTEHLLLGLARERESVAARILLAHGADLESLRAAVIAELGRRSA